MQVDAAATTLSLVGAYEIAVYSGVYDVNNTQIVQRPIGQGGAQGLATWGLSGCHGVAVFGGQQNQAQVDWLAMFHSSGGLTIDRLTEFLGHLGATVPQPGGNFEWVLVMSQGDETAQTGSWTTLQQNAPQSVLFNAHPTQVYTMNGPAPGGSGNAFAVDFAGHWGTLGGNIINAPMWPVAPRHHGQVRIAHAAGKRGCCYLSSACCEHLGLPDDCDELETLRRYRDDVLARTREGRRDIETYYRQAPEIVRQIEALASRKQIYSVIYSAYLLPAVQLIQAGDNEKAYRVYKALVADLTRYLDMNDSRDQTDATVPSGSPARRAWVDPFGNGDPLNIGYNGK